jgi:Domain of unknown function (DUF4333)
VNRRLRVVQVLAIAGILAVAGCTFSTFRTMDRGELESGVKKELEAVAQAKARSVTCPDELEVEVDASTRCTLQAMDGTKFGVSVVVTSVDGDDVRYRVQVDQTPQQ